MRSLTGSTIEEPNDGRDPQYQDDEDLQDAHAATLDNTGGPPGSCALITLCCLRYVDCPLHPGVDSTEEVERGPSRCRDDPAHRALATGLLLRVRVRTEQQRIAWSAQPGDGVGVDLHDRRRVVWEVRVQGRLARVGRVER